MSPDQEIRVAPRHGLDSQLFPPSAATVASCRRADVQRFTHPFGTGMLARIALVNAGSSDTPSLSELAQSFDRDTSFIAHGQSQCASRGIRRVDRSAGDTPDSVSSRWPANAASSPPSNGWMCPDRRCIVAIRHDFVLAAISELAQSIRHQRQRCYASEQLSAGSLVDLHLIVHRTCFARSRGAVQQFLEFTRVPMRNVVCPMRSNDSGTRCCVQYR